MAPGGYRRGVASIPPFSSLPAFDDSGEPPHGADAAPLVLLHAFPLSSTIWFRVLPLLTPHRRVVRVDLPGLGRSVHRATGAPSVAAMAADVLAVLDHLRLARVVLHGVSTGGYVALALAERAPDRVAALALSSTTPWVGEPDVPADRLAVADELERRGDTEPVADAVTGGLGSTAQTEQPELSVLVADLVAGADPAGVAWVARALAAREDTSRVLAEAKCPVLLLFGEEDHEVPRDTVRRMAALRDVDRVTEVEVLPATGHLLALERPAAAARALLALDVP